LSRPRPPWFHLVSGDIAGLKGKIFISALLYIESCGKSGICELTEQATRLFWLWLRDKTIFFIDSSGLSGKRFDEECHCRDAERNRKWHSWQRGSAKLVRKSLGMRPAPSSLLDPKKGRD
jgi:hypothetical protein